MILLTSKYYSELFKLMLLSKFCQSLIQSFPYVEINNMNLINIRAGNSLTYFDLAINLNNQQTWLVLNANTSDNSTTSQTITESITIDYQNSNYKAKEVSDTFYLYEKNHSPIILLFYILYKPNFLYKAMTPSIALPSHHFNEKHSILHQLKLNDTIQHLSFSFITFENKRRLLFGGIPEGSIKNKHHSTVIVNTSYYNWNGLLSQVVLRNESYSLVYHSKKGMTDYVDFEMLDEYIFAPREFMNLILRNFYADLIQRAYCNLMINRNFLQLACIKSKFSTISEISFDIEEFRYKMDMNKLWVCAHAYCYFSIVESPYANKWRFGSKFLNMMNVLFDYESKVVNFYSDNNTVIVSSLQRNLLFPCLVYAVIIAVLSFGLTVTALTIHKMSSMRH